MMSGDIGTFEHPNIPLSSAPLQVDWVERGYPQYYYMMYVLPLVKDAHIVVETGLGPNSDSTAIWLKALSMLPRPESRTLYTVDNSPTQTAVDRIQAIPRRCKWELVVCDSRSQSREQISQRIDPQKIDVLYLDAGHDDFEVTAELEQFGSLIDHKTVILTHDATVFLPKGIFQQEDRKDKYPNGYVGIGQPYTAFSKWVEVHPGWTLFLLTYPLGMALMFYSG